MTSCDGSQRCQRRIWASSACPWAVRDVLEEFSETLVAWGISSDRCIAIELVAAEALNNVVEHACAGSKDIPISFSATLGPKGVVLEIQDEGVPMPGLTLEATRRNLHRRIDPTGPRDDLPEGGFGWAMIHALAETVIYERRGKTNGLSILLACI